MSISLNHENRYYWGKKPPPKSIFNRFLVGAKEALVNSFLKGRVGNNNKKRAVPSSES